MSLVYMFAASRMEGRPVERLIALQPAVNRATLMITGMGPRNAEARARSVLGVDAANDLTAGITSKGPDAVMVIGLCGALSASLGEAAIVAYTEVLSTQAGRPPLQCARDLRERIANLLALNQVPCELRVGITSSRIAVNREEKLKLAQRGASVVDMESYEILSAAAEAGVPTAVVRVVSDSLNTQIPDFNHAFTAAGQFDTGKAARIAFRHPLQTSALLLANRQAMKRLGEALEIVLQSEVFENPPLSSP